MRRVSQRLLLAVAAATAVAMPTDQARPATEPETVATFTSRVNLKGFTEQGGRIAWIDGRRVLHVRALRGGPVRSFEFRSGRDETDGDIGDRRLVLHGDTVFWLSTSMSLHGVERDRVLRGHVVRGGWQPMKQTEGTPGWDGDVVIGIASDGGRFFYGTEILTADNDAGETRLTGGGIFAVEATGSRHVLPAAPPSRVLAAGGGLVAAVPIGKDDDGGPLVQDVIEVRDGKLGRLVCSIEAPHDAAVADDGSSTMAVAIDGPSKTIVVLVGGQLDRYDAATCEPSGGSRVPADVVAKLEAAAGRLVFHTGRTIVLLDLATGKTRTLLTTAKGRFVAELALDGRRVSWTEVSWKDARHKELLTRVRTLLLG
jgi:hypothetical protein